MDRAELEYWRNRGLYINPGVPTLPLPQIRVAPYPAPLVLNEPPHDGERLVYESLLERDPELIGFAAYSMPLPLSENRRIEVDFVALTAFGVALIEVKGGIVQVDSRPGPGVRWEHLTRSGRPTGGKVSPTQLYRATEIFSAMADAMAGVPFGSSIAQLMVFPHTSRAHIAPDVLDRLDSRNRDFMRIVFAEDLAQFGMWRLVEDELAMSGRSRRLGVDQATSLVNWMKSELDVQPGPAVAHLHDPDARERRPQFDVPGSDPASSAMAPAPERRRVFTSAEGAAVDRFHDSARPRDIGANPLPPEPPAVPRRKRWLSGGKIVSALAMLIAGWVWLVRPNDAPAPTPVSAIPVQAAPGPPSPAPRVATAPTRPTPTVDPFQAALTRAAAEPETRVSAGGTDWVRALGPVTGRRGCQFVEMSYAGRTYHVIACRDGDRDMWRY